MWQCFSSVFCSAWMYLSFICFTVAVVYAVSLVSSLTAKSLINTELIKTNSYICIKHKRRGIKQKWKNTKKTPVPFEEMGLCGYHVKEVG